MAAASDPVEVEAEQSGACPAPHVVRICSFNILAPCYGRLVDGDRESTRPELYMPRQRAVADLVHRLGCDVVCLQELWFRREVRELFLESPETSVAMRRTGGKQDGLGIVVGNSCRILRHKTCCFNDRGDRVAIFVTLAVDANPSTTLVLVNTHLTFPHGQSDKELRLQQASRLLAELKIYLLEEAESCSLGIDAVPGAVEDTVVALVGDMNGGPEDPVNKLFSSCGFRSALQPRSDRKGSPDDKCCKICSHIDHRGRHGNVDFVWVCTAQALHLPPDGSDEAAGGRARPAVSELEEGALSCFSVGAGMQAHLVPSWIPGHLSMVRPHLEAWGEEDRVKRCLASIARVEAGAECPEELDGEEVELHDAWCHLSDHRALVADLDIHEIIAAGASC